MKRATREEICWACKQFGLIIQSCILCKGTGKITLVETIEESDDMKEFIEKKCGWELVEKKKEDDCVCPTPLGCYKHWLGNF
jgi:hypothetical protein